VAITLPNIHTKPGPSSAGEGYKQMKTIVMTGGTAGIGLAAATQMQRTPGFRLLVGARGQAPTGTESRELDLARLTSVRDFAAATDDWLCGANIDCLVLNAGMQRGDVNQRTEDGFETTFAVNHLAHYLLLRLLMPRLAADATVVITTSNLHDPQTNPIAPPEHAEAKRLAQGMSQRDDTQDGRAGIRAYAASKLCNILTARQLASSQFAKDRRLTVIAYNPGFIPGTRLTRNQPLAFKLPYAVIVPVIRLFQRMNTVAGGGGMLADLALGAITPPTGAIYASYVKRSLTWPEPSELVRDPTAAENLWRDSADMVGLPTVSS